MADQVIQVLQVSQVKMVTEVNLVMKVRLLVCAYGSNIDWY